jgi:hypothetical protein
VERSGQGSGIQSTFRHVGSALGIAIRGTVLITTLGSSVRDNLRSVPGLPPAQQAAVAEAVRASGGSAIVELRARPGGERIVREASSALADAARAAVFTAAAFVLLGLISTIGLPNPRQVPDGDWPGPDDAGEEAEASRHGNESGATLQE